ncbi:EutN/CcmL family microcompartment protein [Planctomycetota bacterium]|nr:EutN/CcmL family microcompartment protein [Planctomycetota bacterium]
MFLGRVKGHIVATAKDPSISGQKMLVIEPLKVDYAKAGEEGDASGLSPTGRAIVALDMIGAGEGQIVLITQGSSARLAEGCNKLPTDAVVVGIVDDAVVTGKKLI